MARTPRSVAAHARHKKILKQAKGYYGARSRVFRVAKQAVIKSAQYAYRDRRCRRRSLRQLWIMRINAAARLQGMTYSELICGLKSANVIIDRKMMADLVVRDAQEQAAFTAIIQEARRGLTLPAQACNP